MKNNFDPFYRERLFGYERDKKNLLAKIPNLSGFEFDRRLKDLRNKWKI